MTLALTGEGHEAREGDDLAGGSPLGKAFELYFVLLHEARRVCRSAFLNLLLDVVVDFAGTGREHIERNEGKARHAHSMYALADFASDTIQRESTIFRKATIKARALTGARGAQLQPWGRAKCPRCQRRHRRAALEENMRKLT